MSKTLIALVALAACTEPVTTDAEEVAVDAFNGRWHKGIHCDTVPPNPLPEWMPFSEAVIDDAVIEWTRFDLGWTPQDESAVLVTHHAAVVGACLSVGPGVDEGLAHGAFALCLDPAGTKMTGSIVWSAGTPNQATCAVTLRLLQ